MISNAGRSARKMSRGLKWETSFSKQVALPVAIITTATYGFWKIGAPVGTLAMVSGFAVGTALLRAWFVLGTEAMVEKKRTARNYEQGAKTERRTAMRLHWGLTWRRVFLMRGRFFAMHDRAIPGSNANIDHIVVNRNGVTLVDSKRWTGTFKVYYHRLWYGGKTDKGGTVDTSATRFEAGEIQKALNRKFGKDNIPVRIIWAVDAERPLKITETRYVDEDKPPIEVVHTEWKTDDGVRVVDHVKAPEVCSRGLQVLGRHRIVEIARYLDEKFPPIK